MIEAFVTSQITSKIKAKLHEGNHKQKWNGIVIMFKISFRAIFMIIHK